MDFGFRLFLYLLALGISVIFHEQMHARVALWLGDPTGKNDRRLSWNPVHHVDPFMTIILPLVLYFGSSGRFVFGGAKPVMINPLNFRNPSLGMCLSAAAGPLSNFLLATVGFALCVALFHIAPGIVFSDAGLTWHGFFLGIFVWLNLFLGAFNILPLPGLDGSRILRHFLPRPLQASLDAIEPFALFITMIAIIFGAARVLSPLYDLYFWAFFRATGNEFTSGLFQALIK
jgi:Zn-dependent protease